MDLQQSLELFGQGARAWNEWADGMLSEKRDLQDNNKWAEGSESDWNARTRDWHERATAQFSLHVFEEPADFTDFRFPGKADYNDAAFNQYAEFSDAEFHHTATFYRARFKDDTRFYGTKFGQEAKFGEARFLGPVVFETATFCAEATFLAITASRYFAIIESVFFGNAIFGQSVFETPFHIHNSKFKDRANFMAVTGMGIVISGVRFTHLPDFIGAYFEQPPQFDHDVFDPVRHNHPDLQLSEAATPLHSRWRALRRMATQGHDHEAESLSFKGEIIARRGTLDNATNLRFWAGKLYEIFSDFGRSMRRPLIWLLLSTCVFAGAYSSQSQDLTWVPFSRHAPCVSGSGDAQIAAWALSVHNAFPFAGIGSSGKLEQIHLCLYGTQPADPSRQKVLPSSLSPNIPDVVAFLGVLQFVFSAVLLFLLIVAIRHWFRIR